MITVLELLITRAKNRHRGKEIFPLHNSDNWEDSYLYDLGIHRLEYNVEGETTSFVVFLTEQNGIYEEIKKRFIHEIRAEKYSDNILNILDGVEMEVMTGL